MKAESKYIVRDCSGCALQFMASGRAVQCSDDEADIFNCRQDALAAMRRGQENGGSVELVEN